MAITIDKDLIHKVENATKTEHRIPMRKGKISPAKRSPYKEGRAYDFAAPGQQPAGRVQIAAVTRQRLVDVTERDARREGFHSLEDFQRDWLFRHDKAWIARREWKLLRDDLAARLAEDASQDFTNYQEPELSDDLLDERFKKLSVREVWVLTLSTDIPLYLAPSRAFDTSAGDLGDIGYTETVTNAIGGEEVIPPEKIAELPLSREAKVRYDRERAQREAAYARLTVEQKVKLATKLAEQGHIDVAGPMKEIERQADRAIRRGLRKAA